VWDGWKTYCRLQTGDHAYLIEDAFIEYMQRHPVAQIKLSVTPSLNPYAPDVKDRIKNKAAREKISATLTHIRQRMEQGVNWDWDRTQLQKQALQAANLKKPDLELIALLKEAEELI